MARIRQSRGGSASRNAPGNGWAGGLLRIDDRGFLGKCHLEPCLQRGRRQRKWCDWPSGHFATLNSAGEAPAVTGGAPVLPITAGAVFLFALSPRVTVSRMISRLLALSVVWACLFCVGAAQLPD